MSMIRKYRWRLLAALVVCLCLGYLFLPERTGPVSRPDRAWDDVPSSRWMGHIRGDAFLSEINLPGTHDSAACHVSAFVAPWAQCQQADIASQLEDGVRFFDLRLTVDWSGGRAVPRLCHAGVDCYAAPQGMVGDEKDYLTMSAVLKDVYAFLQAHPTETVILSMKEERPSTGGAMPFGDLIGELFVREGGVNPSTGKPFWYTGSRLPTLDEVRGRVVLLRRYGDASGKGLDFTGWRDNATFSLKRPLFTARVEDAYREAGDRKWEAILDQFRFAQAGGCDSRTLLLTYTSANKPPFDGPRSVAGDINARLKSYPWQPGGRYGWVVADFADAALCRLIFATNKKAEVPLH